MRLAIHCTALTQGELRFTIEMCEFYLNSLALIALQLKEFKK